MFLVVAYSLQSMTMCGSPLHWSVLLKGCRVYANSFWVISTNTYGTIRNRGGCCMLWNSKYRFIKSCCWDHMLF